MHLHWERPKRRYREKSRKRRLSTIQEELEDAKENENQGETLRSWELNILRTQKHEDVLSSQPKARIRFFKGDAVQRDGRFAGSGRWNIATEFLTSEFKEQVGPKVDIAVSAARLWKPSESDTFAFSCSSHYGQGDIGWKHIQQLNERAEVYWRDRVHIELFKVVILK